MGQTAVYKTHCLTFKIAKEMTGIFSSVTTEKDAHLKPPYCLRILKPYRTASIQAFRDVISSEVRRKRIFGEL